MSFVMSCPEVVCLRLLLVAFCSISPALAQPSSPPVFANGLVLGTVASTNLAELSGLAASRRNPGILWTHNDGSRDRVYAIDTNGQLLATFEVNENIDDFEDIVLGPGPLPELNYLYIGDIGDNLFNRPTFNVYRTGEPTAYSYQAAAPSSRNFQDVERFTFAYPDGSYDTESFFCDPKTGDLYFATKQSASRIYRAERAQLQTSLVITCSFVRTVLFSEPAAATMSPRGDELILRQESYALLWLRGDPQTLDDALAGSPYGVPVIGRPQEPNGEAISYHPTGLGYYTLSEGANQPIYFFAKTEGYIPPQPVPLIEPASEWKYLDNGSDQGTAWREPGFNAISWKTGRAQFGYGDGDEQTVVSYGLTDTLKHVTTYFRRTFTVADPGQIQELTLCTVFDDGVAIYINGTEVLRRNLAANAGYLTTALVTGNPVENLWQTFTIANSLVAGTNTVAVEVHRRSRSEDTLSFDLQLEATLRPQTVEFVAPPLGLADGRWILSVRGPGGAAVTVEASTDFSTWTDLTTLTLPENGAMSVTNAPAAVPYRFFRLHR